jgi:hypothetical protein
MAQSVLVSQKQSTLMLDRICNALNVAQRGDALVLLQSLPDACTPLAFFDPRSIAVCSTS